MFNINIISLIVPILLAVAFLTTVEWNSLGYMQLCNGPNIISSYELLQPIADAINVFTNEPLWFLTSSIIIFVIAPVLALSLALTIWIPLPIPYPLMNIKNPIHTSNIKPSCLLYFVVRMSLNLNICPNWGPLSCSPISYEVPLAMILLSVLLINGSFTLSTLITTQEHLWLILPTWPLAVIWFISTLAETNRTPFDLTEGESELVSSFNVN